MAESGQQIVIVEDDASMRGSMERLLGTSGFSALVHDSAEEALERSIPVKVACIVSDLRLPGMSGLDLLAELRARGCAVPLILITAYDAPGLGDDALRRGAAAYLVKPFHGMALLDAIQAVIKWKEAQ